MTALIVIGSIIAFFVLLLCIPLGCRVIYSVEGFELYASLGIIKIKLFPRDKRRKTEGQSTKKKAGTKKKASEATKDSSIKTTLKKAIKGGGSVHFFTEVLKEVGKLLKKLGKRLTIKKLTLYYTSAGTDPFDTAMNYGRMSAGMAAILPLIHTAFRVKKSDIRSFADFSAEKPSVYADARISILLGGLLAAVFSFAFNSVKIILVNAAKAEEKSAEVHEKKGGNNNGKASDQ